MSVSSNSGPSKGKMMIAAFRAERLNQRPALRTSLNKSHIARRSARNAGVAVVEPDELESATTAAVETTSTSAPEPSIHASVFASLVSIDVAEQQSGAAAARDHPAVEDPVAQVTSDSVDSREDLTAIDEAASPDSTPEFALDADQPDAINTTTATRPEQAATTATGKSTYDPPLAEIGFGPGMLIRSATSACTTARMPTPIKANP